MASPQPVPFVQFSKELFDAILRSPMPATQQRVVLAIVRRTYGDGGRKQAEISIGLLARMLGQNKGTISRALSDLVERGVVRIVREEHHRMTRILALNKDYETWDAYSVAAEDSSATVAGEQPSPVDKPVDNCPTKDGNGCRGATQRLPGSNSTVAGEQP